MSTERRAGTRHADDPLRPKVRRFVAEYLKDLNAKQGAIRAGYSARTAEVQGCRLLRIPQVKAAVAEGQAKHLQAAEVTAERTLREIAWIAFSDIRVVFRNDGLLKPMSKVPPAAGASIASVQMVRRRHRDGTRTDRVKVRLWDKVRALEILAKRIGLLTGAAPSVDDVDVRWMSDEELLAAVKGSRERNPPAVRSTTKPVQIHAGVGTNC